MIKTPKILGKVKGTRDSKISAILQTSEQLKQFAIELKDPKADFDELSNDIHQKLEWIALLLAEINVIDNPKVIIMVAE